MPSASFGPQATGNSVTIVTYSGNVCMERAIPLQSCQLVVHACRKHVVLHLMAFMLGCMRLICLAASAGNVRTWHAKVGVLMQGLGHQQSLAYAPWPTYDPQLLVDDTITLPVQVCPVLQHQHARPRNVELAQPAEQLE